MQKKKILGNRNILGRILSCIQCVPRGVKFDCAKYSVKRNAEENKINQKI